MTTSLKNPAQQLHRRYWCALGVIAALIVLHQLLLQPALARLTSSAPVVNVSGRQRMLSQKLTKAAMAFVGSDDPTSRLRRREELAATLDQWRRAHLGLQQGNPSLQLPGQNSSRVRHAFQELEPHFQAMATAAEQLLNGPDSLHKPSLQTILDHESTFLAQMHAIVALYESEAQDRIVHLQWLGLAILLTILCVLFAVQLVVVRPAVQLVGRQFAQSEAQYERLVESMNDGLIVSDESGRVQFANRRMQTMLGREGESLVGQPVAKLFAEANGLKPAAPWSQPCVGPIELALQHADGRRVEACISPQRMTGTSGQPIGWLLVIIDVTARNANERRNHELMDQLTHADRLRSMGEMAAGLAHEINQPLGAIANYAEGCLARLETPDSTAASDPAQLTGPLRGILRAAVRGGEIIRRTRSFSRMRPHKVEQESINDLVLEVEQLCQFEARRQSIVVETHLASDLPRISVDGIQIQQVLTNLIQNAFAALAQTPLAGRRVSLTTALDADGHIELTVSDTGPGIPDVLLEQLFEPFVTTRPEGTGMGLAIARSIVESHGGQIRVDRNPAGGGRFRFTLPLEAAVVEPNAIHVDGEVVRV